MHHRHFATNLILPGNPVNYAFINHAIMISLSLNFVCACVFKRSRVYLPKCTQELITASLLFILSGRLQREHALQTAYMCACVWRIYNHSINSHALSYASLIDMTELRKRKKGQEEPVETQKVADPEVPHQDNRERG